MVADCRLTPKEWREIKDCTDALFVVVGLFTQLPIRAEVGGLETLESVQRRLSLTVASAADRIDGDAWECPLCGNTKPPAPDDTPSDPSNDQCTLCGQSTPDEDATPAVQ